MKEPFSSQGRVGSIDLPFLFLLQGTFLDGGAVTFSNNYDEVFPNYCLISPRTTKFEQALRTYNEALLRKPDILSGAVLTTKIGPFKNLNRFKYFTAAAITMATVNFN